MDGTDLELAITLGPPQPGSSARLREPSPMLLGEVASPGLCRGVAHVCECSQGKSVLRRTVEADEVSLELEKLDKAIVRASRELLELQKDVHERVGRTEAEIFGVQVLMLQDPSLREKTRELCIARRINVDAALDEVLSSMLSEFARLEDVYFQERAADLQDVGKRLLAHLGAESLHEGSSFADGSVIIGRDLLPSLAMRLDDRNIRGVILEKGGQTAHATILARARGIPLLIHVDDATKTIRTGDRILIDGLAGRVFINPTSQIECEYDRSERDRSAHQTILKGIIDLPAATLDGVLVTLSANIGKSADAAAASAVNADGIGLYRTEFVFFVQDHLPSEEEQYLMYRSAAERLKPRRVVIRALDIGSDKLLPYFPLPREANPSLGCRGTRLLLAYPELLRSQLRAILRLSATHAVSILFPMINGMEELRAVKVEIEAIKKSLSAEHQSFDPDIPIGVMIETPSAAVMLGKLAGEVDFFSAGTNDLTQYLLATDRLSSGVGSRYEPGHPAVLQTLCSMVETANAKGKSISICGEMAGNAVYTKLLVGLGFRNFSVNPGEILEIKNVIRSISAQEAGAFASRILDVDTVDEVKELLRGDGQRGEVKAVNSGNK